MVLVDTTVWVDYFNGVNNWQTDRLDFLLQSDLVLMGDLIFTEILQGFKSDKDFNTAKKHLSVLPMLNLVDDEMALLSAKNFRKMRKAGITIRKTIDCLIGSWCIHHKVPLLHRDRDFDQMAKCLPLKTIQE